MNQTKSVEVNKDDLMTVDEFLHDFETPAADTSRREIINKYEIFKPITKSETTKIMTKSYTEFANINSQTDTISFLDMKKNETLNHQQQQQQQISSSKQKSKKITQIFKLSSVRGAKVKN
jgi:hypothetical protein